MPDMATLTEHPFPHVIEHGVWDDGLLRAARDEFDLIPLWQQFRNGKELKDACTFETARDFGAEACWRVRQTFAGAQFIDRLEQLTGLSELQYDELGGGLHRIPVGGFLGVHLDFNRDLTGRYRRVNVLLYLNELWHRGCDVEDGPFDDDGGALELHGDDCPRTVPPMFNTQVTFLCSERSWHGHPVPTKRERRSLAAYFFTSYPPDDYREPHDTVFA